MCSCGMIGWRKCADRVEEGAGANHPASCCSDGLPTPGSLQIRRRSLPRFRDSHKTIHDGWTGLGGLRPTVWQATSVPAAFPAQPVTLFRAAGFGGVSVAGSILLPAATSMFGVRAFRSVRASRPLRATAILVIWAAWYGWFVDRGPGKTSRLIATSISRAHGHSIPRSSRHGASRNSDPKSQLGARSSRRCMGVEFLRPALCGGAGHIRHGHPWRIRMA